MGYGRNLSRCPVPPFAPRPGRGRVPRSGLLQMLRQKLSVFVLRARVADNGKRRLRRVEYPTRKVQNIVICYAVVCRKDIFDFRDLAAHQLAAADGHHARARAFEAHEQRRFGLLAGTGNLVLRRAVLAEAVQLLKNALKRLTLGFLAQTGVNRHQAGVQMGRGERVDGVAQAALLADALEQAGGHAAAENVRQQVHREAVLAQRRNAGEGQTQVVLLDLLAAQHERGLVQRRGDLVAARAVHDGKQVCNVVDVLIGEVAGNRDDRVLGAVVFVHIAVQGFGRDGRERFLG